MMKQRPFYKTAQYFLGTSRWMLKTLVLTFVFLGTLEAAHANLISSKQAKEEIAYQFYSQNWSTVYVWKDLIVDLDSIKLKRILLTRPMGTGDWFSMTFRAKEHSGPEASLLELKCDVHVFLFFNQDPEKLNYTMDACQIHEILGKSKKTLTSEPETVFLGMGKSPTPLQSETFLAQQVDLPKRK